MLFELLVFLVAALAGGVAAVVGFGIGSLVTPVLMLRYSAAHAIAAVALPHVIGTAIRLIRLRGQLDWHVFRQFGLASAVGGLLGALLQARIGSPLLQVILGVLLILTGLAALFDLPGHLRRRQSRLGRDGRHGGIAAMFGGALSGLFGGLAGNQGGLRSAALLAFPLSPAAFVATATATALVVDAARLPVYLVVNGGAMARMWSLILTAGAGVVVGTLMGERVLLRLPQRTIRKTVAIAVGLLGGLILALR
jgi:hypothetical protein